MATIGLRYPVFAPIKSIGDDGIPTYDGGFVIGKALEANITVECEDNELYADDAVAESDKRVTGAKITLGVDGFDEAAYTGMFGTENSTGTETAGEMTDSATNEVPEGGLGYVKTLQRNNVLKFRAFWNYRVKFSMPSESAKTKGKTVEWQTPTTEGTIMLLEDEKNTWRTWKTFPTFAAAREWIKSKAGITTAPNQS